MNDIFIPQSEIERQKEIFAETHNTIDGVQK